MVEAIIKDLRLSSLGEGRRLRETKCLLFMDENCGPNDLESHRLREEHKKSQGRVGRNLYERPFYTKIIDKDYEQSNDLHEKRLPHPYRDYENIVDPKSHFLTPGYNRAGIKDSDDVKTDPTAENSPQNTNPADINSDRKNCPRGFEEIDRQSEDDPRMLQYNSREKSLDACRASLRAKTQSELIKQVLPDIKSTNTTFISDAFPEFTPKNNAVATNDELNALKYMYTSTTQKAYEDIPFDSYLHPRRWAPISTLERFADPIRAIYSKDKFYPSVNDWGKGVNINQYEAQQLRPDHFLSKLPHDFCSHFPNAKQIPSYSGCIGAYKKEDIDNPYVKNFEPLTVVRNVAPKFGDCVEKPVFVGYTGKVKALPGNRATPFHTDPVLRNVLGQPC